MECRCIPYCITESSDVYYLVSGEKVAANLEVVMYSIHRYVNVEGETAGECKRVLSTESLGVLTLDELVGFQGAIREERVAELAVVLNGVVEYYL